jgi:UDP-perosamine 4-acetyltransferase
VQRVVVIGAGGHARVCLDILCQRSDVEVVGCVADDQQGELQRPYLGAIERLDGLYAEGVARAFVAIGENAAREKLAARARAVGYTLESLISPNSVVSKTATIGENVLVMPGAVINAYAQLSTGVIVNTGATVDHDCDIGEWVHIGPGAHVGGDVVIGRGTLVGIGSSVLPGRTVGAEARVGGGAAVANDVPDFATVSGVPARIHSPR